MRAALAVAAFLLVGSPSAGQTLLADIDPTPSGVVTVSLAGPTAVGSTIYWVDRAPSGVAVLLWCGSDGTTAGTRLVRELDGVGASLIALGSLVVIGVDTVDGATVWSSDGTVAGTVQLSARAGDVAVNGPRIVPLATVGGNAYFIGVDDAHGRELWKTDGTPGGTALVADVNPGPADGFDIGFTESRIGAGNGVVYFGATDGVAGEELWKSDGTAAGTALVADLRTGAPSSEPGQFVELGPATLFVAESTAAGRELTSTQGTGATTMVVRDIRPGSGWGFKQPTTIPRVGNHVYFAADDGTAGSELWQSDGTMAGTVLVDDIVPGPGSAFPRGLTQFGTRLVFDAFDGSGFDPWITDGSAAGTMRLRDGPNEDRAFAEANGRIYWFELGDPATLVESDGTPGGTSTTTVASTVEARWLGVAGGRLLYRTADGAQLWSTTGAAATPQLVTTLYAPRTADSTFATNQSVRESGRYRGHVFFSATSPANGREVWHTDGVPANTSLFADLVPGAAGSFPIAYASLDDRHLAFVANGAAWSIGAPTAPPAQLQNSVTSSYVAPLTDGVAFATGDRAGRWGLWFNDGDASTPPVLLIGGVSSALVVADARDHAFLASRTSQFGADRLWLTDGTVAGTSVVLPSVFGRVFYGAAIADDVIVFVVDSGSPVLWTSDGTAAGTIAIATLPGSIGDVSELVALGDRAVFTVEDPVLGCELWVTDGTMAGTHVLADIVPGPGSSAPQDVTVAGDRAYLSAFDPTHGRELWVTDGTAAGTVLVADLEPGFASSSPREIRSLDTGSRVVFAALTGDAGREPWVSDGTATRTVQVADIWPGPLGSDPRAFVPFGQRAFVTAVGETVGREPWGIDLSVPVARTFGRGGRGAGGVRPELFAIGEPAVGNAGFGVGVRNAAPLANAGLLLSAARTDLALLRDCLLYAAPPPLRSTSLTIDGAGVGVQMIPVPNDPNLVGFELYAQCAIVDAAGCFLNLVNVSDAMRIVVGL